MAKAGRPPRLSREQIVAAVVDLLEKQGVGAVSTRTVGEALGVHPTALYRYFRDMGELVREAADQILAGLVGEPPWESFDRSGAIHEVHASCRRLRTALMAHPGAASVMMPGPSRKPNERRFTERMLQLLVQAGLPDEDAALSYHALVEFVVGSCAIDTAASDDDGEDRDGGEKSRHDSWRQEYLSTPTDYPTSARLAERLYPSQDRQFEYGLELIVRGIAARVPDGGG